MARRPARTSDLPPELAALVSQLTLDQMRQLVPQLLAGAGERLAQDLRRKPPSRRRPRREPATFVLRIDLAGMKPPIWRRVEVPSTLMLDQVHELIQLLFGWMDSHLHRFALGSSVWDRDAEVFLCPYDVEEGEVEGGVPEDRVRLDELLAEPGDLLRYVYDYGDEWGYVLKLEKVNPELCQHPRVLAGKFEAPEEDCGFMYEDDLEPRDLEALNDDLADWACDLGNRTNPSENKAEPYPRLMG